MSVRRAVVRKPLRLTGGAVYHEMNGASELIRQR
jgi:hypothetical protein